jgi:probable phosphoglycerate mutase
MNIFLVRHGKDDDKYRGGWSNLPLIQEGIIQSKLLAEYLKDKESKYNIQIIISSDLLRTKQTAEIIQKELCVPVHYTYQLREINNGKLAGMLNEDVLKLYPGLYFSSLKMNEKYPGGESPKNFYDRIKSSFYDILEKYKSYDNILLVTHSGVINIICCIVKGVEWSNSMKNFEVSNAAIHKLVIDSNGRMKFEMENNIIQSLR